MTRIEYENEGELVRDVVNYLNTLGHFAWRNNTGAARYQGATGRQYFVRFSMKGASDVFAIQKGTGRFMAIECKMPGKKPTPDQVNFLEMVTEHGGLAIVAHSLNDIKL